MERLGESFDFGECLLEILEWHGWKIHDTRRAFAGNGVMLFATHPDGYDVQAEGPTVTAAATQLFLNAPGVAPRAEPKLEEEQLALEL